MFNDEIIANPSNLVNTPIDGINTSGIISIGGPNTNLDSLQSSYIYNPNDISNPFIIADIPTIFTIVYVETCGPKLVRIKYTMADPQLNTLSESGNIYISSGVFGVYNSLDNFY